MASEVLDALDEADKEVERLQYELAGVNGANDFLREDGHKLLEEVAKVGAEIERLREENGTQNDTATGWQNSRPRRQQEVRRERD